MTRRCSFTRLAFLLLLLSSTCLQVASGASSSSSSHRQLQQAQVDTAGEYRGTGSSAGRTSNTSNGGEERKRKRGNTNHPLISTRKKGWGKGYPTATPSPYPSESPSISPTEEPTEPPSSSPSDSSLPSFTPLYRPSASPVKAEDVVESDDFSTSSVDDNTDDTDSPTTTRGFTTDISFPELRLTFILSNDQNTRRRQTRKLMDTSTKNTITNMTRSFLQSHVQSSSYINDEEDTMQSFFLVLVGEIIQNTQRQEIYATYDGSMKVQDDGVSGSVSSLQASMDTLFLSAFHEKQNMYLDMLHDDTSNDLLQSVVRVEASLGDDGTTGSNGSGGSGGSGSSRGTGGGGSDGDSEDKTDSKIDTGEQVNITSGSNGSTIAIMLVGATVILGSVGLAVHRYRVRKDNDEEYYEPRSPEQMWNASKRTMSDLAACATQLEFAENGMRIDIYGSSEKKKKKKKERKQQRSPIPNSPGMSKGSPLCTTHLDPIVEAEGSTSSRRSSVVSNTDIDAATNNNLLPALSFASSDESPTSPGYNTPGGGYLMNAQKYERVSLSDESSVPSSHDSAFERMYASVQEVLPGIINNDNAVSESPQVVKGQWEGLNVSFASTKYNEAVFSPMNDAVLDGTHIDDSDRSTTSLSNSIPKEEAEEDDDDDAMPTTSNVQQLNDSMDNMDSPKIQTSEHEYLPSDELSVQSPELEREELLEQALSIHESVGNVDNLNDTYLPKSLHPETINSERVTEDENGPTYEEEKMESEEDNCEESTTEDIQDLNKDDGSTKIDGLHPETVNREVVIECNDWPQDEVEPSTSGGYDCLEKGCEELATKESIQHSVGDNATKNDESNQVVDQCMVENDVLDAPKDELECDGKIACEQSQANKTENKVNGDVEESEDNIDVRWLPKDDFYSSGI